ncbi:MAG TPA: hypothetical protein VM451_09430 [Candidatus Limnocylindria bacterium]|nr:hypothetical protein [Candidatus Limnocylindria bacterium]
MIVVGILATSATEASTQLVTEIARRAAATGATGGPRVEVLGVVPGDAAWDRVTLGLAAAGVGHATVVRSSRGAMEPADLDLALHYLPDIRAIVLVHPPASLVSTALAAASWSGAPLVLIGPPEASLPEADPAPIILEPPSDDPDGTFAGFVAALAVRLEAGDDPAKAWKATIGSLAVDRVSP